jgi:pyridoxal phosphate enzyme (YggS family)
MNKDYIVKNVENILKEIPPYIKLVAVIKGRSLDEIELAIKGGVNILGINYVKDGIKIYDNFKNLTELHFIGHLQTNKINKAIKIFNTIQTLDSINLANEINKRLSNKFMSISFFIEINIAKEKSKFGIDPDEIYEFAESLSYFNNIKIEGVMTMGPNLYDEEIIRYYFRKTREIYENLKKINFKNFDLKYLSMGMSDSYKIAIEEGSNMIRIGKKIFEKNL